jgi:transcriptional regulator with XRE-family HTH domain
MKKHTSDTYTPELFIDSLIRRLGLRSSSALARKVGLSPSVISKVRHRRLAVSGEILLKIHEETEIPIRELRHMMGDTRPYFSPVKLQFSPLLNA